MVTGQENIVQTLHFFQLVFKNLSLSEPLEGYPQEFVF
jgi:hypothetical protein